MQVSAKSPIESGRGARFLSLVKQNKLNVSPQLVNKRRFSICDAFNKDRDEAKQNQESFEPKEYLKFSSQLKYDPEASPSSSILSKRKADTPDTTPLTSSMKRKRVGFRDPVSSTKVYLITEEEERLKSSLSRCLNYETEAGDDDEDDLISNKENVINLVKEEPGLDENAENLLPDELSIIRDDGYNSNPQNTDVTTSEDLVQSFTEGKLIFRDKNELMEYITKNLTADEMFEKLTQAEEESTKRKELISKIIQSVGINGLIKEYFPIEEPEAAKLSSEQKLLVNSILREISGLMKHNQKVKHVVLDNLSEEHSNEFLEHAIQENSTKVVCEKITVPKIINYLVHKVNFTESHENDVLISDMNRSLLRHLIDSTHEDGAELIRDKAETQELLRLLFKNKPKMEIFDTVQVFLRTLVQNH